MQDPPRSSDRQFSVPKNVAVILSAWIGLTGVLAVLGVPKRLREVACSALDGETGGLWALLPTSLVVLFGVMVIHGVVEIGRRRLREEQLRQAEASDSTQRERYQGLLRGIDAGTIICQPRMDGAAFTVADMNPAAQELSGVERADALGVCPTILLPPEHHNALRELVQRVWRTGVPAMLGELPFEQDGRRRWYRYHAFKIPGGEVVITYEDITAQRDAENERQLLSAVVQQMQDALVVMDHRGVIVYVNEAFEQLYGYPRDEMLGQLGQERLIDAEAPEGRVSRAMRSNMELGRAWSGEYEIRRQDGDGLWVHGTHCPVQVGEGQPAFWFSIVHDVTERREMEQRFRTVTKMEAVGQLAGGIAHDFNNLLTVINGYSQMALMTVDDGDPARHDFEAIAQAGERAAGLVQQLLAFSRRQVMRMQSVQLNDQIVGMDRILASLIPEHVDLTMDLQTDLAPIEADPTQVEQVIINLVANACDAMPDGGDLSICTREFSMTERFVTDHDGAQLGNYALLEVADTGTGIAPEIRDHIFEPFYTTKELGKGTGLGLATVYGIVKQSQGYIYVDSEPGVGSTFCVYMPLAERTEINDDAPTLRGPMAGGTETLLIAEDEAIVRYVTAHFMMRLGYHVLTAGSGREAMALYESHLGQVDMLIADIVMPEMNGHDLARELLERQPDLAVLMVTGYADNLVETRADMLEQAQVLRKPYDQHELARLVREALDARATFLPRGR